MLTLSEELFILSLHEDKCTILSSAEEVLGYGLSATVLAELAVRGVLQMDERRRLEVVDGPQIGDEILEDAVEHIQGADHPRKIPYWIGSLSEKPKKFRDLLVERLVTQGLLQQEDKRLFWAIPSPLHPELNASSKYAIKSHLRTIVMTCGQADPKVVALLSVLNACELLDLIFLKDETKIARRRISELLVGEALRSPNFQIVEEIQSVVKSLCEAD